ncbi:glucuronoxylan 4-O-methyltransferase 3-like [Chenopodium quinoa]|nr:glucuronoxylan 4-O-methyltransferase 3-like [Chenopodium quinoa]
MITSSTPLSTAQQQQSSLSFPRLTKHPPLIFNINPLIFNKPKFNSNFIPHFLSIFFSIYSHSYLLITKMRGSNSTNYSKILSPTKLKLTIFCFLFFCLVFLTVRSSFSSSSDNATNQTLISYVKSQKCPSSCTKIPPSISDAIIHYATSNITPQQTAKEISVTDRVLRRKSPSNFLVFGLGYDSPMWASLNHGGRTVFLEENEGWIRQIKEKFPTLESYLATYDTKVRHSDTLLTSAKEAEECSSVVDPRESKCNLALKGLPKEIYEVEWDLIMVDAPTGYHDEAPGRMSAIYTAGLMGRNREEGETDVFVHDVDRVVEDKFSMEFLCQGYMVEQQGRLRHFTIPSHKARIGRPFCPPPKPTSD